jgi:hypothetical protein
MATQIVILNDDYIKIDDSFHIDWADKGNAMPSLPSTVHAVLWNDPGEIQNKDASSNMTGNTDLNATSDAVGSTTVSALLTWGETRKGQINSATLDEANAKENAKTNWIDAGNAEADFLPDNPATSSFYDWSKTWRDYDSNYS